MKRKYLQCECEPATKHSSIAIPFGSSELIEGTRNVSSIHSSTVWKAAAKSFDKETSADVHRTAADDKRK